MALIGKTIRGNPFRVTLVVLLFWFGYYSGSLVRPKTNDTVASEAEPLKSPVKEDRESSLELLRAQVDGMKHFSSDFYFHVDLKREVEKTKADKRETQAQLEFTRQKVTFLENEKVKPSNEPAPKPGSKFLRAPYCILTLCR